MIQFLRKHASFIGWTIVISFIVTSLVGAIFMGSYSRYIKANSVQKQLPQDFSNQIAIIGETPVSKRYFYNYFTELKNSYRQANKTKYIDPETMEYLLFLSFREAIQYTIFQKSAKEQNIKVTSNDLKAYLASVYKSYDIKGKKELKKLLKKSNYSYKTFISDAKKDLLAQKFQELLFQNIKVTDKDVENSTYKIHLQHILISIKPSTPNNTQNLELAEESAKKKAQLILKEIQNGLSFAKAVKKYSSDFRTRANSGDLGWIRINQIDPNLEEVAFALEKNEISLPVKTRFGYHILRVIDRQKLPIKNFNFETRKKEILRARQNMIISNFIQPYISKLKILDPNLLAIDAKNKGEYELSAQNYQKIISQNPANPVPNFLLAQIYLIPNTKITSITKGLQELERASIKAELSPDLDFPELHILKAVVYKKQKNKKLMNKSLDKAISLSKKNLRVLKSIKEILIKQKDKKRLAKVNSLIKILKSEEKLATKNHS